MGPDDEPSVAADLGREVPANEFDRQNPCEYASIIDEDVIYIADAQAEKVLATLHGGQREQDNKAWHEAMAQKSMEGKPIAVQGSSSR